MAEHPIHRSLEQVARQLDDVAAELAAEGGGAEGARAAERAALARGVEGLRAQVAAAREAWGPLAARLEQLRAAQSSPQAAGARGLLGRLGRPLVLALACLFAGQLLFALNIGDGVSARNVAGLLLSALAVPLALRGFGGPGPRPAGEPGSLGRGELLAALGVVALGAALRALWLDRVPFLLDGDAAAFAMGATNFVAGGGSLFGTGWMGHTNVYFALVSLPLRLFGLSPVGVRALGALGGALGVLCTLLLARALLGRRAGLIAGLVTALLPFHLVFSRVGTEVVHLTWLAPLAFLLIWEGWRRRAPLLLVGAGAVTAVSQYFYPGARLIPILCVAQVGLLALLPPAGRRDWRRAPAMLGWLGLGFVALYAPMIAYYLGRPDTYTARLNEVSILSSGWLAGELARRPWWDVIGEQVRRAYLPFLYPVPGPRMWYVLPRFLGPLDAALLALGLLGLAAGRGLPLWLRLFLALYLGLGMFLAGVLTIDPPMPSRYVIFVPPVVLLIGYAADRVLAQIGGQSGRAAGPLARALLVAALCLYGAANLRAYLEHDTRENWSHAGLGRVATLAARYLHGLPNQDYAVFYLREGGNYYNSNPTLKLLAGNRPGVDLDAGPVCPALLGRLAPGQAVVIAPGPRAGELEALRATLPAAEFRLVRDDGGEPIVALLRLDVPPAGLDPGLCGDGGVGAAR